jgi:tetratricopeptide (TPR) repeat protein
MKTIRLMTFLSIVLFSTIVNAQSARSEIKIYNPELRSGKEMSKVKSDITNMLNERTTIHDKKNNLSGTPKDILVLDDRIEFKIKNQNTIINFSDLIDDNIVVQENSTIDANNIMTSCTAQLQLNNFVFTFEGPALMRARDYNRFEELKNYADDLYFIQYQINEKRYSTQLPIFESIAAQYRTLKIKPLVSEEQRKYIVQANLFNQQKMYDKAIDLYKKAIDIDQTTYPAAYSNLALLSAQIKKFNAAIYYMKKYLMLEPEASDARSAQDKIYEWEVQIKK